MGSYKSAKRVSSYDDGDDFVASDQESSTRRPTKKSRNTILATNAPIKDSEGNLYWEISKQRRVTISEFKGKTLVNIREYYEKDGKDLPGKKGISMTVEQYSALIEILPQIEKVLKDKGESVPQPSYGRSASTSKDEEPVENEKTADRDEEMGDAGNARKSNFEATSDEEED